MGTDSNAVAAQFVERLGRLESGGDGELHQLVELFSDDAVLVNPALEHRGTQARGREGVLQFWKNYRRAFRDIRSEFSHIIAGDNAAGLFWRSTGSDCDGNPVSYAGATLLEINASGKISGLRGYFEERDLQQSTKNNTSSH